MKKRKIYKILTIIMIFSYVYMYEIVKLRADLRVCNDTKNRIGVAIAYKDLRGWVSEGWWNMKPESCQQIIKGPLIARYYYIYANDYDESGIWAGNAPVCVNDKLFTIRKLGNCEKRGYTEELFFEVDTKEEESWVVSLAAATKKNTNENKTQKNPKTPPENNKNTQ